MGIYVAYLRVSTDKQGKSGLGLEAQQAAINGFLRPDDRLVSPVYVEVESGKRADRPELQKALARCKATGATLLVAKLDRLARNVAFIANLLESGVEVVAADMPTVNRLTLHILAAVAEEETRMISARTKAALKAAKVRGVKLGGDRGYRPDAPPDGAKGAAASVEARKARAARFRFNMLPKVQTMREQGASLREIAAAMNAEGMPSPGNGKWTAMAVSRVLSEGPT